MHRVRSQDGTWVSYDRVGSGPPLVLVHGSFSDHETNWALVQRRLATRFTVYAMARRGRGETVASEAPRIEDEAHDVRAVVEAARNGGPSVFLLGHSHGALCALEAATQVPTRIAKLVLYEPLWPHIMRADVVEELERLAARNDRDAIVETFLREILLVAPAAIEALRRSADWETWTRDALVSLADARGVARYRVDLARIRALPMPTLLLVGSESPRPRYLTDALATTVRDARVAVLEGQAHEGMTTAPGAFCDAIEGFLLDAPSARQARIGA